MTRMRQCKSCKIIKPLEEFNKNKSCREGRTGTCKFCTSRKRDLWYAANRDRRQEQANTRNRECKLSIVKHFGGKCLDCNGTFPPCVYEFHHIDPSQKDVNPSQAIAYGEERMWRELNKCVMLCANCHRIRHFVLGEKG